MKYELQFWTGFKAVSLIFDGWRDAESNYRQMSSPKRLIDWERGRVVYENNWRF